MIDTLVIGWLSDIPQITPRNGTGHHGRGPAPTYGVSLTEGALYVTYETSSRLVKVRISVPAWAGRQRLNWPLRPLPGGVEDLRLPVHHALRRVGLVRARWCGREHVFEWPADRRLAIVYGPPAEWRPPG